MSWDDLEAWEGERREEWRRVCEDCKEPDSEITAEELLSTGLTQEEALSATLVRGGGCTSCSDTGFKGRIALYEVMELTEELKEFVLNGASAVELKREAIRGGMLTLRRSALNKLLEGVTTLSEVFRVSSADN